MIHETDERYSKKLRAIYMIFKENQTQQDVAEMLNISKPTLTKLISEAVEEGIVKIEINDVRNIKNLLDLEIKIKKKYNLSDVRVVDCVSDEDSEIKENIGKSAARYFDDNIKSNLKIGLSWGTTMEAFISNLAGNPKIKNLQIVTIVGGSSLIDSKYQSNILAQRMLEKYSGKVYFLYSPIYANNETQYKILIQNNEIRKILDFAKKVDVAVVGIGGSAEFYSELNSFLNRQITDKSLLGNNIVGSINGQFLDIKGNAVNANLVNDYMKNYTVGIDLNDLKKIKKVIALAGGNEKHEIIRAVLLGGYVNILITDKFTAEFLIN